MIVPGHPRITIEPGKMGGAPCIRSMRFPVRTLVRLVASGMSVDVILAEYPGLEADDIPAALRFAADAAEQLELIQTAI